MKTILTMIVTTAIFIAGWGFGSLSATPAPPKQCKVIKIDYNPEVDEPASVWYKGVNHER